MKSSFRLVWIITLVFLAVGYQRPSHAAHDTGFNLNFIAADDLFTDYQGFSLNGIQEFLNTQTGILKSYKINDRSAAQIIYDAAQAYQINPKVILVTLQKEASLITDPNPSTIRVNWAMGYGVCDSCDVNDPALQDYKGFDNQVDLGTKAFRRYLNDITAKGYTTAGGWGPSLPKDITCIDSDYNNGRELCTPGTTITITPANAASAALYTYTPHPGGNFSYWYIWNVRFNFNQRRIYPDGSLLRAQGSPDVWLIQSGQKRRFATSTAFLSRYSFSRVITVAADHLAVYETGRNITHANYSLLSSPSGGIYLLANDIKRPIKSRQAFSQAGYRMAEVVKVDWDTLNQWPDGEPITTDNVYPSGRLMQNKKTGGIYYVKDGIRYPVISKAIFRSQFGAQRPHVVSPEALAKYQDGLPVGFKDGELLTSKTGGTAYFISNGYRLPIASWAAAQAYKFDKIWGNIVAVDDKVLAIHPVGPTLDIENSVTTAGQP